MDTLRIYRSKACKSKTPTSPFCYLPNEYKGGIILVLPEQLGGRRLSPVEAAEMSLAPGGLIKQTIIEDDILAE